MKISTEHRDALNEALDETAGYEGDVYVFDVKHIETLRSAVIAMLEDDEQIATVSPAVDAQPVAIYQVQTGDCWLDMTKEQFDNHSKSRPTRILHASAQSEGLRKDAERYRWLRDTLHGAKAGGGVEVNDALQVYEKPTPGEEARVYWYQDTPVGFYEVHGATLDEAIDAALSQHTGEKDD